MIPEYSYLMTNGSVYIHLEMYTHSFVYNGHA